MVVSMYHTLLIPWICLLCFKSCRTFSTSNVAPIQNYTVCRMPLGLSDHLNTSLIDFKISATDGNASHVRLSSSKSWISSSIGRSTYIELRASRIVTVTGMEVKGDEHSELWVTSLIVKYSMDCVNFYPIYDGNRMQVFAGNIDPHSVATIDFKNVIVARCIQIIPTERHGNKTALRLELLGCVARSCSNKLMGEWKVNVVHEKLEMTFPSEKIISVITIKNDFTRNSTYAISYSRSCAEYMDIEENGEVKKFFSKEGDDIIIDLTLRPLRVICFKVTSLDADITNVNDVTVQLVGCGVTEHQVPLQTCGTNRFRSNRREKRVIGGSHAVPGEWPWLVSLHFIPYHAYSNESGFRHLCGATLIHPQWVLSAAHCFEDIGGSGLSNTRNWKVIVGEHNQADKDGTEQEFQVKRIIRHPLFRISEGNPILYDIALLKLDKPAILSDYVNVVCMDTDDSFPPGTPCVAAGWGQNRLVGPGVKLPLHAEIPIIHPDVCDKKYRAAPEPEVRSYVSIQDSVLCASTEEEHGKDSCRGDSGGPLVCRRGDHWAQVGIVSFGMECARYPGIYTKVAYFMKWISRTVEQNSDTNIHTTWHRNKKSIGATITF